MPRNAPQNADQESNDHKNHSRPYQQQPLKSKRFDPLATSSRSPIHSNPSSKPVTPRDSSADLKLHEGMEHSNLVLQSLHSSSQAVEQSTGATLPDAHHFITGGNTRRIVTPDQQNVNNWRTEYIGPEIHVDQSTARVAMFENAHNLRIENAPITNIGHQHVYNHGNYASQVLDNRLKEFVSFSALHDSSAQDPERCCHLGTRKNVLQKMRAWTDDPNASERILWLHGPAGVGKSAIAQTISGGDKVGASFFFFRSDAIRNNGNRLFPTLAWRLASSVPIVKDFIASSLDEDPDLPRKAIEAQFKQLITQPFLTICGGSAAPTLKSLVIIIDGLDECSDMKLQRRILDIIGKAITDTHFPLRFIIASRPEANIQDFFDRFHSPTLQIDLANVDDAFRDIETYLRSQFARIAEEQDLDPEAWPGQDVINTLVSNSSGQFVYASTVIRYVGDEYESAVTRLKIILGLKPRAGESPFSVLDALYTEILQRQPDKNFLKDFLALLVTRIALSLKDLHKEDAVLLGFDSKELHRKLRGMRSVLKSKPFIDVHHKSFLDFLHDSSRSGEYHVSEYFANKRYMELITDVLVKAASKAMEQPDSHGRHHFQPTFAKIIQKFPLKIKLPLNDLEEILQPLLVIQEKLLQLPNMSVPWKPRACENCWTFSMIDDLLLHLACLRGSTQLQEPKYVGIRPLTAMEEEQDIPQLDLDTCLSLLLAELRSVEFSLNVDSIGLVRALIRFDATETAMKVRSMTDAQNLLELIFCLNKKESFQSWFGAAAHNATRLALAIYGRMPFIPRSIFLNSADLDRNQKTYQGKAVEIRKSSLSIWRDCFSAFVWGNLTHGSIVPCLGIYLQSGIATVSPSPDNKTLKKWWLNNNASLFKIRLTLFEVAKAIQYIHSLGIWTNYLFDADGVYLDSDNHVKIHCPYSQPIDLFQGYLDYDGTARLDNTTLENDIRRFGLLFYQVLFDEKVRDIPETRPNEPEIPDNVWQFIQWCCAKDWKKRPTIYQVIQEMESWISLSQFTLSTK